MRMPFFIEMHGKTILIIGGGEVALRRVEKYSKTGARIIIFSKDFKNKLIELASKGVVELVRGDVADTDTLKKLIKESHITMVTIGTKKYNEKIKEIAEKYNKLLNLANDSEETDVVVPIDSRIDSIRVAVTTEGKSSMVAREALLRIIKYLKEDEELNNLMELMYMIKNIVKKREVVIKERMKIYHEVFSNSLFREALRSGDLDRAKAVAFNILKGRGINPSG